MNDARLEIFADDIRSPPHLSRSIPAALDGLIDDKTFREFADQIDVLLELLDAEHERFKNRYWWTQYGIYSLYPGLLLLPPFLVVYFVYTVVWIIYLASVRLYTTYFKKGPKSIDEIVKEIRSVCEVMTDRTPHVSFHPMFRPFPLGSLQIDSTENINISISDHAFAEVLAGAAVVRSNENDSTAATRNLLGNATIATPCDYQLLEVV